LATVTGGRFVARRRIDVRLETEPIQIVEHLSFGIAPRPLTIVIFDAQDDPPRQRAGKPPHVDGVDDVSEMEIAGRCWRETREQVRNAHLNQRSQLIGWPVRMARNGKLLAHGSRA
jgi:hypothetical protein